MCHTCAQNVSRGQAPGACCLPKTGVGVIATCLPYQDADLYENGASGQNPLVYSQALHIDGFPIAVGQIMGSTPQLKLDTLQVEDPAAAAARVLDHSAAPITLVGFQAGQGWQLLYGPTNLSKQEVEVELRGYLQSFLQQGVDGQVDDLGGGRMRVTLWEEQRVNGFGPGVGSFEGVYLPKHNLDLTVYRQHNRMPYDFASSYKIPYDFDGDPMVDGFGEPSVAGFGPGVGGFGPGVGAFGNNRMPKTWGTGSRNIGFGDAGAYEIPYEYDENPTVGTLGEAARLPRRNFMDGSERLGFGETSVYRVHEFDSAEMSGALRPLPARTVPRSAVAAMRIFAKGSRIPSALGWGFNTSKPNGRSASFLAGPDQERVLKQVAADTIKNWQARGVPLGVVSGRTGKTLTFTFYVPEPAKGQGTQVGDMIGALLPWRLEELNANLAQWGSTNRISTDRSVVRAHRVFLNARAKKTGAWGTHYHLSEPGQAEKLVTKGRQLASRAKGAQVEFKLVPINSFGKDWYLGYFTDDPELEVIGVLHLPTDSRPAEVNITGALFEGLQATPAVQAAQVRVNIERLLARVQRLYGQLNELEDDAEALQAANVSLNTVRGPTADESGGYISPKSVKNLSDAKLRSIATNVFRRKALKEAAMEELDKRAEKEAKKLAAENGTDEDEKDEAGGFAYPGIGGFGEPSVAGFAYPGIGGFGPGVGGFGPGVGGFGPGVGEMGFMVSEGFGPDTLVDDQSGATATTPTLQLQAAYARRAIGQRAQQNAAILARRRAMQQRMQQQQRMQGQAQAPASYQQQAAQQALLEQGAYVDPTAYAATTSPYVNPLAYTDPMGTYMDPLMLPVSPIAFDPLAASYVDPYALPALPLYL